VDIERGGSYLQSAAQGLARQLKPVGIRAKKIRFGETSKQGFERSDFEDAWSRYLVVPAPPGTTSEHRNIAGQGLFLGVSGEGAKSASEQGCSDVPMQEGGKVEQSVWDDPGDPDLTFWSTPEADAYLASMAERLDSVSPDLAPLRASTVVTSIVPTASVAPPPEPPSRPVTRRRPKGRR
jgi:hypothetical protein